jgi:hypothetical protein
LAPCGRAAEQDRPTATATAFANQAVAAVPYHPAVAAVSDYRAMAMAMAMGWKVTSSFIECSQ